MRLSLLLLSAICVAGAAVPAPALPASPAKPTARIASFESAFRRGAPLPKWTLPLAEIPATVRTDPVVVRLNETQAWAGAGPAITINRAIQVNDASALGTIGQFSITYYSAYQKLSLHRVLILRNGQRLDQTATVAARPLQRETNMESGMVGGATTLQLLLSDVRVGDTLSIVYTIEGENPVFGKHWSNEFDWDGSVPIELRRLTILHPSRRPLAWRMLGDFRTEKVKPEVDIVGEVERMRFEGRAIEAVEAEPSIPNDYITQRMLQFTEFQDWQGVATWAASLFPREAASPAVKSLARQFAREPEREAQVSAALHWVQNEIRYFSVSIGENSHRPQVPDVVIKRRYGDCKDKSYLLISLLAELGIEARPVLLSVDAPLLPARVAATPTLFNHALVQVRLDGRLYYVDPTRTGQPEALAQLPTAFPGAAALIIDPASTGLVNLPERTGSGPKYEQVENIVVSDFSGKAALETIDIFRSNFADAARLRYPVMSPAELKKTMLAGYEKRYPGVTLNGAPEYVDNVAENRVEIRSRYELPHAVSLKDKAYAIEYRTTVVDGTLGIPDKLVRNFPLELASGRFRGRYRLNLSWPDELRADEVPYVKTIDNQFFRAHEEYTFRGNTLNFLLDYQVKEDTVKAADVPALQVAGKRLEEFSSGRFRAPQLFLVAPPLRAFSTRDLDSLRAARALTDAAQAIKDKKDADILSEDACAFISLAAGVPEFVGAEVNKLAARLARVVAGSAARPGARLCQARLSFARGEFAESVPLYQAEMDLKDDSPDVRRMAWARFYAGDREGALATMARYRGARDKLESAAWHGFDLADEIALWQRAGKPVAPELLRAASDIPDGPWPRPLLAMQAGVLSPEQLLSIAEALPADARAMALTEAWFYIGQARLASGDVPGARTAFQRINVEGMRTSDLYLWARAELRRTAPDETRQQASMPTYKEKTVAAAAAQ